MNFLYFVFLFGVFVRVKDRLTKGSSKQSKISKFYDGLLLPLFIMVIIITFVGDVYHVPTSSMFPAIKPDSSIIVSKVAYGLVSPIDRSLLFRWSTPQRGDVVVIKAPATPGYTKRIIALPGERVQVQETGEILINGVNIVPNKGATGTRYLEENVIEDVRFTTQRTPSDFETPDVLDWVMPEDRYFVMGDNRDKSVDSRYFGPVKGEWIFGQIVLTYRVPGV